MADLLVRCADGSEMRISGDALRSMSVVSETCLELKRDDEACIDFGTFVPDSAALGALFEHSNADLSFETVLKMADAMGMKPAWFAASRESMDARGICDADGLLFLFCRNLEAMNTWPARMATAWKGASGPGRWMAFCEYPALILEFVNQRPEEGARLLVGACPTSALLLPTAASNMAVWHALWMRAVADVADADVRVLATLENRQWLFDRDFASSVRSAAMEAGIAAGAVPRFTHGSSVYDNAVRNMLTRLPQERIVQIIEAERHQYAYDTQLFKQMLRVADTMQPGTKALEMVLWCKYRHMLLTAPQSVAMYTQATLIPNLRHPLRVTAMVRALILAAPDHQKAADHQAADQAVGEVLAVLARVATAGDSCIDALEWAEKSSAKQVAAALVAFGGNVGCRETSSRAMALWPA
jgi:hypothetical protein